MKSVFQLKCVFQAGLLAGFACASPYFIWLYHLAYLVAFSGLCWQHARPQCIKPVSKHA
jgi:hypothetical protein